MDHHDASSQIALPLGPGRGSSDKRARTSRTRMVHGGGPESRHRPETQRAHTTWPTCDVRRAAGSEPSDFVATPGSQLTASLLSLLPSLHPERSQDDMTRSDD